MNRFILPFLAASVFLFSFQALAQQKPISQILYKIIQEDGIEKAIAKYHSLKENNADKFNFAESELNYLGYQLLGEGKVQEAKAILKLNTEEFPTSANVFDSYAEVLMKLEEVKASIQNYEKVLKLVDNAAINPQLGQFLKTNATRRLSLLRNPNTFKPSPAIDMFVPKEFENPFGKLHPDAPPETEQWGQLVGVWHCITSVPRPDGQWISGWPATWAWKYILDGFAVQDVWMQDLKDMPPNNTSNRHFVGTNLRMYDRFKKRWDAIWFQNSQVEGGSGDAMVRFTATFNDGKITMIPVDPPAEGQPMRRIIFYNMGRDSFDWNSETSTDAGKTWIIGNKIHGTRIR